MVHLKCKYKCYDLVKMDINEKQFQKIILHYFLVYVLADVWELGSFYLEPVIFNFNST